MGRRRRTTAGLLGVAAIEPDGLLVGQDGVYVRYLEVGAVNPLVLDPAEGERVSAAFAQVAARLPDRQSVQLYVQSPRLTWRSSSRMRRIVASRRPAPPRTSESTPGGGRSAGSGSRRSSRSARPRRPSTP